MRWLIIMIVVGTLGTIAAFLLVGPPSQRPPIDHEREYLLADCKRAQQSILDCDARWRDCRAQLDRAKARESRWHRQLGVGPEGDE